jgi:hypothetical protein
MVTLGENMSQAIAAYEERRRRLKRARAEAMRVLFDRLREESRLYEGDIPHASSEEILAYDRQFSDEEVRPRKVRRVRVEPVLADVDPLDF